MGLRNLLLVWLHVAQGAVREITLNFQVKVLFGFAYHSIQFLRCLCNQKKEENRFRLRRRQLARNQLARGRPTWEFFFVVV